MVHCIRTVILLGSSIVLLSACGGGGGSPSTSENPSNVVNQSPTVDAGTDETVVAGETVELAGTASDTDGTVQSIVWVQTTGPSAMLDSMNSLSVSFIAPNVQTESELIFELTVADDDGAQAADYVTVSVLPPNGSPGAVAGADQVVAAGSIVQLDGDGSSDPDNDPISYSWSITDLPTGSSATLDDASSPTPTFMADLPGEYSVALVVSDGNLSSNVDELTITAGTPIGGLINSDLLLIESESPYIVTDTLQIPYGNSVVATDPVEILGKGQSILVGGVLDISGLSGQRTILRDVHIVPATGPDTQLFTIRLAFTHLMGGSLYAPTGNAVYGSLNLTDSIFENLSEYIYLWYPETVSQIERNVFSMSGGISVGTFGVDVVIRNNVFVDQTTEYAVENWADYGNPKRTVVDLNSFLSTDRIALRLPPGYSNVALDGRNNFWNSTEMSVIGDMIFDQNDSIESAGIIPFDPILLQAHPDTPIWP
jgi:hypothetical protein